MSSYVDMDQEAREAIEALEKPWGAKITELLDELREHLLGQNMAVSGVVDMCTDTYRWCIDVGPHGQPKSVEFAVEINEAHDFDGEPADGVNFGMTVVEYGGRILGGCTPHNYTPLCWVSARDPEQVAYRFGELAGVVRSSLDELADLLLRESECRACGITHPGCSAITLRCCDECDHPITPGAKR